MDNNVECNKECGIRLKLLIKENNFNQTEFASKVGFTAQYISDLCTGKKNISDRNARIFANVLNSRYEYILCEDDYKTELDKVKSVFKDIGSFALSHDASKKLDTLSRKLDFSANIAKDLLQLYGYEKNFETLSFEEGFELLSYLDDSIVNALDMYFKYIKPKESEEKENEEH